MCTNRALSKRFTILFFPLPEKKKKNDCRCININIIYECERLRTDKWWVRIIMRTLNIQLFVYSLFSSTGQECIINEEFWKLITDNKMTRLININDIIKKFSETISKRLIILCACCLFTCKTWIVSDQNIFFFTNIFVNTGRFVFMLLMVARWYVAVEPRKSH